MSFISTLTVDGRDYNVLATDYDFEQQIDASGKVTGKAVGGILKLVVEADGSVDLLQWANETAQLKSGSVTFYKRDVMAKMQTLNFEDGICYEFQESFDGDDTDPLQIKLTITAKVLTLGDVPYNSSWAV